jgi:aromatic ring-opening dioxygenase LigB subunit
MAGIVFGAVAPHGWPLIHDLSDDADGAMATRLAMEELGRRCAATNPDLLVLATPHNIRVEGQICLPRVARGAGALHHKGRTVEMNVPVDMAMTERIALAAREAGLPIAIAGFAGNNPDQSAVPLDWGTMVPLWFLGHGRNLPGLGDVLADPPAQEIGPPVVIVSPSRSLPRKVNVQFGEIVAGVAAGSDRRVAFIASCDWAHAHEGSRYGEHRAAKILDAAVVGALKAGDPGRLIDLEDDLVENAAIDGLWQALMLAGVLNLVPMRAELLGYEIVELYATGMAVASFVPT